jgi:hypothetical protein
MRFTRFEPFQDRKAMTLTASKAPENDVHAAFEDERLAALSYLSDAWDEAMMDGLPPECMAHVALFRSISEFVLAFGEEATADFVAKLPERIRQGDFSVDMLVQD